MSSTPEAQAANNAETNAEDGASPVPCEGMALEPSPPSAPQPERPLAPGLYLVGTPIGNLEDITLRALRVLRSADRIACEDTRQTQKLLQHYGIRKPTVSYHLHNEVSRSSELVAALQDGARIALVSDAGLPGIADPGEALVQAAIQAGVAVYPIPGANAALSALIASGLTTERFLFLGFLPARHGERRSLFERLRERWPGDEDLRATLIAYEAPHRLLDCLGDIVAVLGPLQPLVLARELTKVHEEFLRGTVADVQAVMTDRPAVRGELVLLLGPPDRHTAINTGAAPSLAAELRRSMAEGLSEKEAIKRVAKARGLGKSEVYREWQRSRDLRS